MGNLKQQTAVGMSWSLIENIMGTGTTAIISIILANLLTPHEVGLVGMIAIFITLSNALMDGGFSGALIRKTEAEHKDYCTVFYTNLAISILLYAILYLTAPVVADFLNEPVLCGIIRIMGSSIIILAFSQVQRVYFIRRLDFKTQAIIAFCASLCSGAVSIVMAVKGWGVWSLVAQLLSKQAVQSILLWLFSSWKPGLCFSVRSFREMFNFGSKLVLSSIVSAMWSEVYAFAMGKLYTPAIVGLYSRADKFKSMVTSNIGMAAQRAGYPVLSRVNDDKERQMRVYRKMVRSTTLVISTLVSGLIATAPAMVETLIGEQWLPCAEYLRILALSGIFLPLMLTAVNLFNANGNSNRTLTLELIKTALAAIPVLAGVFVGIYAMLWAIAATTAIAYLIHLVYVSKEVECSVLQQIKDILPFLLISAVMGCAVYAIEYFTAELPIAPLPLLLVQVATGAVLTLLLYEFVYNCEEYREMKSFVLSVICRRKSSI